MTVNPVVGEDVTVHIATEGGWLSLFEEEAVWLNRSMKGQRAMQGLLSWFLLLFVVVFFKGDEVLFWLPAEEPDLK